MNTPHDYSSEARRAERRGDWAQAADLWSRAAALALGIAPRFAATREARAAAAWRRVRGVTMTPELSARATLRLIRLGKIRFVGGQTCTGTAWPDGEHYIIAERTDTGQTLHVRAGVSPKIDRLDAQAHHQNFPGFEASR